MAPLEQPPLGANPIGAATPFGMSPNSTSFDAFGAAAADAAAKEESGRSALRTPSAKNPFTMRRAVDPITGEPVNPAVPTPIAGVTQFGSETIPGQLPELPRRSPSAVPQPQENRAFPVQPSPWSAPEPPAPVDERPLNGSTGWPVLPTSSSIPRITDEQSIVHNAETSASGPFDQAVGLPVRAPRPTAPSGSLPLGDLTSPNTARRPDLGQGSPAQYAAPLNSGQPQAPAVWDPQLPSRLAGMTGGTGYESPDRGSFARPAPSASNVGSAPASDPTLIATTEYMDEKDTSPIFDSISAWFADPLTTPAPTTGRGVAPMSSAPAPSSSMKESGDLVIDLRDQGQASAGAGPQNRWATLRDQDWLAASARAAAAPEVGGESQAGLPIRRPGANLVASSSAAKTTAAKSAPATSTTRQPNSAASGPSHRADPESVRGRLGSYQRGVASARRARQGLSGNSGFGLGDSGEGNIHNGQQPAEQGGEQ